MVQQQLGPSLVRVRGCRKRQAAEQPKAWAAPQHDSRAVLVEVRPPDVRILCFVF